MPIGDWHAYLMPISSSVSYIIRYQVLSVNSFLFHGLAGRLSISEPFTFKDLLYTVI